MGNWKVRQGLQSVGAYQVSGEPFVSGGIDCDTVPVRIAFPYVTRWVSVINHGNYKAVKVAFSEKGFDSNNFFKLPDPLGTDPARHQCPPLELKVSELWVYGSNNVEVIAGLTSIDAKYTSSSIGPSWSGSVGVG